MHYFIGQALHFGYWLAPTNLLKRFSSKIKKTTNTIRHTKTPTRELWRPKNGKYENLGYLTKSDTEFALIMHFPRRDSREKVTMGTITAIPNSPLHQVVLKRLGYGTGEEEDAEERHQCRPVSDIDSAKKQRTNDLTSRKSLLAPA